MTMRKISLVLFLVVWTGMLFAQTAGKVSGTVADESGQPLAGANVSVVGTSFGGASDENGTYYILAVPAGNYEIRADYIGYKSNTVGGVRVSTGLTTFIDHNLAVAAVEGESVEVIGERPLLEMSATSAVRSMDSDQITNFSSRDVTEMVTAQAGVVGHNSEIHLRGSRQDEVGFTLDGVSTKAAASFNNLDGSDTNIINAIPEALQEVSVQSGGYSAEMGGANAGIVQQTMKTGGRTLSGSIGYETDALASSFDTDELGLNDFTFTLGGPLTSKIRFFGAYRLNDTDNYRHQWWSGGEVNGGAPIWDSNSGSATPDSIAVVIPDEIEGRTQTEHLANATLLFDYNPIVLRASGAYTFKTSRNLGDPQYNLFNKERQRTNEWDILLGSLKATYFLNTNTYVHFTGSMLSRDFLGYEANFDKPDVLADALIYADSAAVADKGLDRFVNPANGDTLDGTWSSKHSQGLEYLLGGFEFARPGRMPAGFQKSIQSNFGFKGGLATQAGSHEIKTGFEYTRWNNSLYNVGAGLLRAVSQRIEQDPDLQADLDNQTDKMKAIIRGSRVNNYGYDEFGNEITDAGNVDGPKQPFSGAFYINDKIEKDDLVVNAGIRVDAYNMDDFALDDVLNPPFEAADFTVDAEGLLESETKVVIQPRLGLGFPISDQAVFHLQYGKFVQMPDLNRAFNGRAILSLHMGGQNFIPNPTGFALEPVVTEQFEVGFGYQLGNVAALDATVFAKNTTGQLEIKWATVDLNNSTGAQNYAYYANGDFTNVSGIELTARTRRINNLQFDGSYTFTDARGTNSFDGSGAGQVQINGDNTGAPTMISPLRYENKHKGSATVDLRWADNEGGILENAGLNLFMTFNSGHPFTLSTGGFGQRSASQGALLSDNDPRVRVPAESIGASTTPWIFNFNLRAEKGVRLGNVMLTAYALVENLLNTQHIVNVYNRTGNAYNDGFLNDPQLGMALTNSLGESYVELYEIMNLGNRQHWINDEGFDLFGTPREFNIGISASF